ncbi:MAG: proline--tRNA ligase [Turicibacter sp.]|nr:proline--tRNA ligase [Turicibacter sp.]
MKQTRAFIPTLKEVPGDAQIVSHQLLLRAGLIRQVAAGIYTFLPLGKRVLEKIETIVREEHAAIDCVEMFMPVLHPKELWDQSGRWDVYGDELMRMKDRHGRDFAMGPTHEEVVTTVAKEYLNSYKKLPLSVYQIQTKFRDEQRPRFGLMRGREFIMKDAYSFHATDECLDEAYNGFVKAYNNIYARCGLDFRMIEADNGQMGGSGSAEFMAIADVGEDTIVYNEEGTFASNIEVHDLQVGDPSPDGVGVVKHAKGIELGHVFKLGTKYSESMGGFFLDENGEQKPYIMGCYGIGVSRIMMAALEQRNDENGIVWSKSLAPFDLHVIPVDVNNTEQLAAAEQVYADMKAAGFDVLIDDRDERAGVKFKDADLIGLPIRLTIGKGITEGMVEFKNRQTGESQDVALADLKDFVQAQYDALT